MCFYEDSLSSMLTTANVRKQSCYTPREVEQVLNISRGKLQELCEKFEPPNIIGGYKHGLECYRVGTHRRIPHHGILRWMQASLEYNRRAEDDVA